MNSTPLEFPKGFCRNFQHPKGRIVQIRVADCRVYSSLAAGFSTRISEAEAQKHAAAKVRKLLREGYLEIEPSPDDPLDFDADIVSTLRAIMGPINGKPRYNYQPFKGKDAIFVHDIIDFKNILICSAKGNQAIHTRSARLSKTTLTSKESNQILEAFIDVLDAKKDDLFSDRQTPVRKFALEKPIGNFNHYVVLSPAVYNYDYPQLREIRRSLWFAFLCYDNEFNPADSLCTAEARYSGRHCLPYTDWERDPHFVLDLWTIKNLSRPGKEKFQVYPPSHLQALSTAGLSKMKFQAIVARNYNGQTRRFLKNESVQKRELLDFFL